MATSNGDAMVLATQHWLNTTYKDYVSDGRFSLIEENGKTGWATIYGLTKALQIELGISPTANNFGPTTIKKFNERYPNGVRRIDIEKNNVFAIIQGALWCKGYSTGHYSTLDPDKGIIIGNQFDERVENAIKKLQADAGRKVQTGVVDLNIMKALLSMDYFVCSTLYGGDSKIQKMQQYLNGEYEDYIGLCPCDGVYGRKTNTALIYAIQAEEGMATSVANGNFGPSTKRCCPTIPYKGAVNCDGQTWQVKYNNGLEYTTSQLEKFIKLVNIALYVNGMKEISLDSEFSTNIIKKFQKNFALPITGVCDLTTWLSMFISCGDTEREAKACDCATILTVEKAKTLYDNGYRYVGRYLSNVEGGMNKALTKEELEIAFNAGLRIFPIHQLSANHVSYFTEEQGIEDADLAYDSASNLGIPENTIIYFSVDCDPQDSEIKNYIIPYFGELYAEMVTKHQNKYKIGVYGTRNVCNKVREAGYTISSFVCDMSTGFSGNLGFTMPIDWAFDQFATVSVGSGNGKISIDKDGYSGRDSGFGNVELDDMYRVYNFLKELFSHAKAYKNSDVRNANLLSLQYLRYLKGGLYGDLYQDADKWSLMAGPMEVNFCLAEEIILGEVNLNFIDSITGVSYDLLHMAATLNALLYPVIDEELKFFDLVVDDYAGWAGDMLTFAEDIRKNNWNQEEANQNICSLTDSSFGLADYCADIDAVNICTLLMENEELSLPEAFFMYFMEEDSTIFKVHSKVRTSSFLKTKGTYNEFIITCNTIAQEKSFPYPKLRSMFLDSIEYNQEIEMSEIAFLNFIGNQEILECDLSK